jgi:hypothetical protein
VHRLQGKAELVNDVLALLREFRRETLAALDRHQAGARLIGQYDANNTYQYIINREATQLSWLEAAIRDLGGPVTDDTDDTDDADDAGDRGDVVGQGLAGSTAQTIVDEDARAAKAFVERWRPRVEGLAHARHRQMLRVILGEVLEQQRFFEHAGAGRTDLLGLRGENVGARTGSVMADRWIE